MVEDMKRKKEHLRQTEIIVAQSVADNDQVEARSLAVLAAP
jgi:hypothetical protein